MTKHIARVLKLLDSRMTLSLLVSVLFGMAVLVVQAASEPPEAALPENASRQNVRVNSSLILNQETPVSASSSISTTGLQSCNTYHFYDRLENVGADGNQRIANITPPSAGSPAEISADVTKGTFKEVARFYSHPSVTTGFNIFGDISSVIWVQSNAVNMAYKIEMFDYDPTTGNTILLGDFATAILSTGINETQFNIAPSVTTIPVGHRVLLVLSARASVTASPPPTTAKLFYDSADRDSRFTTCQLTPPNLTISKNGPATTIAGQPITYTLTISNSGGLTATNLAISDTIPTGATYISGGTQNGNVVSWFVASLASNTAVQRGFVVSATETITNDDYQITADGNISAIGQNNVVTVVSQPGQPNLAIYKSGPVTAGPNELVNYTLTVVNGGDTGASNLVVSDTIPAGATYVSGGTKLGNAVIWTASSLAPAASLDFNFAVTATSTITNDGYQVVADGNIVTVGKESATTVIIAKPPVIYLPLILPSIPMTTLVIKSENTGGIDPVRILDPDNNNDEVLRCTVGNNVVQVCGTFPPIGKYNIIAHTNNCGVLQGTFNDANPNATITRRVYCE